METEGLFAPETEAEARAQFDMLEPAAGEVVRTVAKAMEFDTQEYSERVGDDVVESAREALYASLLEVNVDERDEYERWCEDHDYDVVEVGAPNVDRIAWHAAPFAATAVSATFQNERDAAIAALRRQAFGRLYRDIVRETEEERST